MKAFKIFAVCGAMLIGASSLAPAAVASDAVSVVSVSASQTPDFSSPEMVKLLITEMRKQLPMQVEDGMYMTAIDLTSNNELMFTFTFNCAQHGVKAADFAKELKSMSKQEIREMIGNDIADVEKMTGRKVVIKMILDNKESVLLRP